MKKIVLLLLVLGLLASTSYAQIINQFTWDLSSNELEAEIGPNAISSGSLAYIEAMAFGSDGIGNGVAPGFEITYAFGVPIGTTKHNINLQLGSSLAGVNDIEFSIDYRRDQPELNAAFFALDQAGGTGPQFYLGIELGRLVLRYTWDNGAGGATESFVLLNHWPGPNIHEIPTDLVWRNYRFTYESTLGLANLYINGTPVYTHTTVPGAGILFPSSPAYIGKDMDNEGIVQTLLDNAIIQAPVLLPVEWGMFAGEQTQRSIQLDWETFEQINFDHFEVQHSTDAKHYSPIGKVSGPTNTEAAQQYAFTHERPEPGANYYRLRQVDLDGAVHYSNRIEVNFELDAASAFAFYPNPVQDRLFIGINEVQPQATAVQIHLYDLSGRLLSEQVRELIPYQNETFAETQELPSGAYLVKVSWMGRAYYHRMTK